jgi:bifunctional oligoribonuclease and PAP phosphatase NrnA
MNKSKKTLNKLSASQKELFIKKISQAAKILIVTHQNPDGDAIGSSLGLYHALKEAGKDSYVIVPNDFPAFLKWMPASEKILVYEKNKESVKTLFKDKPLVFFLDFNELSRTGKLKRLIEESSVFSILIDHHPDPANFSDVIISDIQVSSTAEMIYGFVEEVLGSQSVSKASAESIYTGIMTDTGSFSYNSSNPETYKVLSALLTRGIDKDLIYSQVYDNFSEDRMKLLGYCLDQKMVVLQEYQTAYISLTNEEKKKYSFQPGDSEGFVNYPLSVSGIHCSVFFMENGKKVKISFRSRGKFPVNALASRYFQGGGHKNAAGGESDLPLDKTILRFKEILPEFIEDFNHGKVQ